MIDVLVALLLLAVVLAGAGATLLQAMRSTHRSLLATRAVDMAADMADTLRGTASLEAAQPLLDSWRAQAGQILPVGNLGPDEVLSLVARAAGDATDPSLRVTIHELTLRWVGPGTGREEVSLPLVMQLAGRSP